MPAADAEHEQDRVEAEQQDRRHRVAAQAAGAVPDEPDAAEAREARQTLDDPQPGRRAQPGERVAGEGEQRAVGARDALPSEERVHRVVDEGAHVHPVRIHVVDHPEPRVLEIAEDVLGQQRGRDGEDDVQQHDRADRPTHRHGAPAHEDEPVGEAHRDQREEELRAGDGQAERAEDAIDPGGRHRRHRRDLEGAAAGRAHGDHEAEPDYAQKAERADPAAGALREVEQRAHPEADRTEACGGGAHRGSWRIVGECAGCKRMRDSAPTESVRGTSDTYRSKIKPGLEPRPA